MSFIALSRALCLGALAVTSVEAQQRLEFRIGGVTQLGQRNSLALDQVSASSGRLSGAEVVVQYRGLGLQLRLLGGEFAGDSSSGTVGDLAQGDVSILLGTPAFAVQAAYSRRAIAGPRSTVVASGARPGFVAGVPIGASGITMRIAAGVFLPAGTEPLMNGYDLETGLLWLPRRWPAYAQLGYRHEQFTLKTSGTDVERPEELGSIVLGAGFRIAR